jgi:hypothetical protein
MKEIPMTRLETLNPELAEKLRAASENKRRAASLAACEFAISQSMIDEPLVREVLDTLRWSSSVASTKLKQVEALMTRLDERYFDLHDATEDGRAAPAEYLRFFSQARAVSATLFACKENSFEAATEAIYEASHVAEDQVKLFTQIEATLR